MQYIVTTYRYFYLTTDRDMRTIYLRAKLKELNPIEQALLLKCLSLGIDHSVSSIKKLVQLALVYKPYPDWLVQSCYDEVKDWTETISLLIGNITLTSTNIDFQRLINEYLSLPKNKDHSEWILSYWKTVSPDALWFFNKMITGQIRPLINLADLSSSVTDILSMPVHTLQIRLLITNWSTCSLLFEKQIVDELPIEPLSFIIPEEIESLQNFGPVENFVFESFIHGHRKIVYRLDKESFYYTLEGEWQLIPTEEKKWIADLPSHSIVEIIQTAQKIYITDIYKWNNKSISNKNRIEQKEFVQQTCKALDINLVECIPYFIINEQEKNSIQAPASGWILKHISHLSTWYRIKPTPHEAWLLLSYVEIKQAQLMIYTLTLSAQNEMQEWVPIAKLNSDTLSQVSKTYLYYWIQNNSVQKFGPVRTVRLGMGIQISYDRIELYKKSKAGIKLVNTKFLRYQLIDSKVDMMSNVRDILERGRYKAG